MSQIKNCTSCGAALQWRGNDTQCKCDYCGTITVDEDAEDDADEDDSEAPQESTEKAKYTVTICRKSMYYGMLCATKVLINGQEKLSLSSGETKTLELEAGPLQLKFQAFGFKPEMISLHLQRDISIAVDYTMTGKIKVDVH